MWRGLGYRVFMTCDLCQQVVRVKRKLGVRFTRQGGTTSMFEGFEGTLNDMAEGYVCV